MVTLFGDYRIINMSYRFYIKDLITIDLIYFIHYNIV